MRRMGGVAKSASIVHHGECIGMLKRCAQNDRGRKVTSRQTDRQTGGEVVDVEIGNCRPAIVAKLDLPRVNIATKYTGAIQRISQRTGERVAASQSMKKI